MWSRLIGIWALAALPLSGSALAAPIDYDAAAPFGAEVRVEARTYRYTLYEVRFPSPVKSPFPPDDTVWGHLYVPRPPGGRAGRPPPCVLVLPVMAAPTVWIEKRFVHAFLRDGMAAMWLEMPYQFHRRPGPHMASGQAFLARTPARLAGNFRQSVLDARRALSWLEGSGLVDGDRLGMFGISLGAMVGSTVLSVDPRPRGGVFLLGGADFPGLIMRGSMTSRFVRRAGMREEVMRAAMKGLDPLDYKDSNAGRRVVLINARQDTVVPPENALRLKEAFPSAAQVWVPFGHYTAILHLIWVPDYAAWKMRGIIGGD